MVPASAAVPKSSGMSSWSGPMKFDDAPPGCTAPTARAAADPAGQLDQLAHRGAHRHAVDVRAARRGRTRRRTSSPTESPTPCSRPPLRAALHDDRHVGEGLHRVHQRGPPVQAVVAGERRLVARLAAVALHALQQRGLLAEDVAAGRDEHLDVQPAPAAAGVRPDHPGRAQRVDLGAQHVLLGPVLVPDEDPALLGADHGHAEQQALQHQVRLGGQDLAVLERARLGLVGVADRVLVVPPGSAPRTSSHFCPVGKPAPPMPRSPESFSVATIVVGVELAGQQRAQRGVALGDPGTRRVRVVRPRLGPRLRRGVAHARRPERPSTSASTSRDRRRALVDGHRRRDVAAAQAGDLDQLDVGVVAVALPQLGRAAPRRRAGSTAGRGRRAGRPSPAVRCGSAGRTRSGPRSRSAAGGRRGPAPRAPRGAASRAGPGSR